MVIGQILGVEKVVAVLGEKQGKVVAGIKSQVTSLAITIQGYVKNSKLTGQVLHVRTDRLRRSITFKVTAEGTLVSGVVGTNVVYARIHEFGGVIKRKARTQILRFRTNKNGNYMHQSDLSMGPHQSGFAYKALVFAKKNAKGDFTERKQKIKGGIITMPERSFLRSSLDDKASDIRANLQMAIREALK